MANGVLDLKSIDLSNIIGASLNALVQAEAQAARTTIEFIEKVGFLPDPAAPENDIGSLRMVEFTYIKPDENGDPAEFVAKVPVLALLPIPGIRIRTATLEFSAKISDAYTETTSNTQSGTGESPNWLGSETMQFRGSLVSSQNTNNTTESNFDLHFMVEIEQTPMTPGMEKLLNLMDLAIGDQRKLTP